MKNRIANFIVSRIVGKGGRRRLVVNLKDAKSVGILFLADSKESCQSVKEFREELGSYGIETTAIGFINKKEAPGFVSSYANIYFFTLKNCYWYGAPHDYTVRKFIATEFSILIDLTFKETLTTKYITGRSQASLKVGKIHVSGADVMIDMEKEKKMEPFINEIKKYLSILKPSK